jgi:hypothetical protein
LQFPQKDLKNIENQLEELANKISQSASLVVKIQKINPPIDETKLNEAVEQLIKKEREDLKQKVAIILGKSIKILMQQANINNPSMEKDIYKVLYTDAVKEIEKVRPEVLTDIKQGLVLEVLIFPKEKMQELTLKASNLLAKALQNPKEFKNYAENYSRGIKIIYPQKVLNCKTTYPNRYLLGVFIWKYKNLPALEFVKNDEELIKNLACKFGVPKENIIILENPTLGEMRGIWAKVSKRIHQKDALLIFYYSGHGIANPWGYFYFLPSDADASSWNTIYTTGFSFPLFENYLSKIKGKKVVFIDACRVLKLDKGVALYGFGVNSEQMAVVFSTTLGKVSSTDISGKYSAFTKALYDVLTKNDLKLFDTNDDGYIEIKELIPPLKNKLKEISTEEQTPQVEGNEEIPLVPLY